jgi:hypothetical protein
MGKGRELEPQGAAPAETGTSDADRVLDLLERVEALPAPEAPLHLPVGASCTARIVSLRGMSAEVRLRGHKECHWVDIDGEVDPALLVQALEQGDLCLLERGPDDEEPVVVGVVHRRLPSKLSLSADVISIEGKREILLRAGTAALRLREDGDVELVGTRISAASRGLFKLVGRMLRLN